MKVKYGAGLNTFLFVIPVLFILTIYFGIGVWLYFSGAADLLKDFHSAQLVTMLSDKKNSVELWIDTRRKSLGDIAGSAIVTAGVQALSEAKPVKKEPAGEEAPEKIKKLYVGKRVPDEYRKPGAANPIKYTW